MRKFNIIFVAVIGWLVLPVLAQTQVTPGRGTQLPAFQAPDGTIVVQPTDVPRTKLEVFEAQTQTVIIRGISDANSMLAQGGAVTVRWLESKDARTGRKESGVAVGVRENDGTEESTVVDYDELGSLLDGIDTLIKVDRTVTTLAGFNVSYMTRGGLRIAVFTSNRRLGTIQAVMRNERIGTARVFLSVDELARLRSFLQQAKSELDGLRANPQ